MQTAIEMLPTVGAVDVSTNGATIFTNKYGAVTTGAVDIVVSGTTFIVGDWIRIGSLTGPVYSVSVVGSNSITISSGYTGSTSSRVPLYSNARDAYQYIISFDSNLGDIPAMTVDASNLKENNIASFAYVTACDQYITQLVQTTSSSAISGTFSLEMGGEVIYKYLLIYMCIFTLIYTHM
jgi:hypothetical protein